MKDIQIQAAEKAIRLLKAAGAQYKVIFDDGTEFGDLEVVTKKKRTRVCSIPSGTMAALYKSAMDNAQVGDVLSFSFTDIDKLGVPRKSFRSAASAYASATWGNGSYTSTWAKDAFEILRIK